MTLGRETRTTNLVHSEKLVADARDLGLADEAIAIGLLEAVKALREGVA